MAERFGTKGSPISLSTACASGASAIQLGIEAIRRGETQAALCIGTDGSINPESLVRFSLLSALSTSNDPPQAAAKPFAKNRDGFVMAEGAAALVLESLEHALARGAKLLGVIEGCGEMANSFHRTRSSPDGRPIIGCIRNAIADAGLTPDDIDYVNPHGTGTPENDKMEGLAATAVFGERAKQVPISSNKSMIGHTLSAAGAVEAVITLMTLDRQNPSPHHQLPGSGSGAAARRGAQCGARRQGAPRALQFLRLRRPERLAGARQRAGVTGAGMPAAMRALTIVADRKLELIELAPPPPPGAGEVQIRVKAVALNHIDVWGWRGMAFAKRKLPLVVGAEAAGEIAAVGPAVDAFAPGQPVVMYGGLTCGVCKACREGRDNLCESISRHHGLPCRRLCPRSPQHAGAPGHAGARRARHAGRRLRPDRVLDRAAHAVR